MQYATLAANELDDRRRFTNIDAASMDVSLLEITCVVALILFSISI